MSDSLQRLLDAELRAQRLVDDALARQERTIEEARQEAEEAERRFEEHMHELSADLDAAAEERAARCIAEMERDFEARGRRLRAEAGEHREAAIAAAIELIIDPERL